MRHPRTPFSTPLSGSARETELRLHSIFQWKKGRPPVLLLLLAVLIALGCGGLVSCQEQESPQPPVEESSWEDILDLLEAQLDTEELSPESGFNRWLMDTIPLGEYELHAACFYTGTPQVLYAMGITDKERNLIGDIYQVLSNEGTLQLRPFQSEDGEERILYTVSGMHQGYTNGSAGVIALTGEGQMGWVWPVEGDLRDPDAQVLADYDTYWTGKKPLMSPMGVDIFRENPDFGPYAGAPVQWTLEESISLWSAPEDSLAPGVYDTVRRWLEEFTRDKYNPYDANNTSAQWAVVSLTPVDGPTENGTPPAISEYDLVARSTDDHEEYLYLRLSYDHGFGQVVRVERLNRGGYAPESPLADTFAGYQSWFNGYENRSGNPFTADGRTLNGMDVPENPVEETVWNDWYYEMSGQFDKLMDLQGTDPLQISALNTAKQMEEGLGFQTVTVHTLNTLTVEDLMGPSKYLANVESADLYIQHLDEAVKEYSLTEYALVHALVTWEWTPEAYERGPQLDNGTYQRVYLVGKAGEADSWKLYDVYWWEMIPGLEDTVVDQDQLRQDLILMAMQEYHSGGDYDFIFAQEGNPLEYDQIAITGMEFLGEQVLYETVGEAWRVGLQYDYGGTASCIAVLDRSGYDNTYQGVHGAATFATDGLSVSEVIQRVAWGMEDMEVTLYRLGYPAPMGIGRFYDSQFHQDGDEPTIEVRRDWDPIYWQGDYWDIYRRPGFTALRYYQAAEGIYRANTIDVTRDDFSTPRGIHVGSTRAEVLAAYPESFDGGYWNYDDVESRKNELLWQTDGAPTGDYLWYCGNEEGWGAALLFFFEDDIVTHIRLNNMFN